MSQEGASVQHPLPRVLGEEGWGDQEIRHCIDFPHPGPLPEGEGTYSVSGDRIESFSTRRDYESVRNCRPAVATASCFDEETATHFQMQGVAEMRAIAPIHTGLVRNECR